MGLLDNYGKGPHNLGMTPRPNFEHQLLISKIIRNLSKLDKKNSLLIMPETRVTDKRKQEYAPDVVIYRKQDYEAGRYNPLIIIEIERTRRIKSNITKVKEIYKLVPELKESFIYDYEAKVWYLVINTGEVFKSSNSLVLSIDLNKLVV